VPRPLLPALVQPRIRPAEAGSLAEPEAQAPTIEISIGRIEWRAQVPPARPQAPPTPPAPAGFAAYAALRAGLDRGRR
jgi:hypothetical protein